MNPQSGGFERSFDLTCVEYIHSQHEIKASYGYHGLVGHPALHATAALVLLVHYGRHRALLPRGWQHRLLDHDRVLVFRLVLLSVCGKVE